MMKYLQKLLAGESGQTKALFVPVFFFCVAIIIFPSFLKNHPFELRLFTIMFLYASLGHGWNVLGGYAGQTSIGHGLFFGLGAYGSTMTVLKLGLNPWFGMVIGASLAAGVGLLIGLPCFRLRGHYFVIATLVVAESAYLIFTAWEWVGGAMGQSLQIRPEAFINFQFHHDKRPYYYIALAILGLTTMLVIWLERSRLGVMLQAIREDEEAFRSLGFSPQRYKLIAMAMSAAIVGVGGSFYSQYVLFIDPPSVLALPLSVIIALIPILGGVGTVAGPILGAAILVPISEYSRVYFSGSGRNLDLLIYGFLIMIISVYQPQGLMSLVRTLGTSIMARNKAT